MSNDEGTTTVYTPSQVSKRLGVNAAMTRRYLLAYEKVAGVLPRDSNTGARLVSEDAMSQLETARVMVQHGEAQSIAQALGLIRNTVTVATPPKSVFQREEAVLEELRRIRLSLERLEADNAELRRALEAPARPWWRFWD